MKQRFSGICDWCKKEADDLVEHKDFEEGMASRDYDVCKSCRNAEKEALAEELEELSDEQLHGFEPECYMGADGYCSAAGSEHCDWDCQNGGC